MFTIKSTNRIMFYSMVKGTKANRIGPSPSADSLCIQRKQVCPLHCSLAVALPAKACHYSCIIYDRPFSYYFDH